MGNLTGQRDGNAERAQLRELLRRVEMKVIYENHLDVLVRLHSSLPPGKIGMAEWPVPTGDTRGEMPFGPNAGLTEVLVPAGYVQTAYDASFTLSADKKSYVPATNEAPTPLSAPGLPFSLVFRSEPGKEDLTLKVASAYQAASKRRVSPPEVWSDTWGGRHPERSDIASTWVEVSRRQPYRATDGLINRIYRIFEKGRPSLASGLPLFLVAELHSSLTFTLCASAKQG